MNWPDERYVKLYTRDSESWLMLSWQARALLCFALRKADRAGVLETRHGARGLAVIVGMPLEQVEPALAELLGDGCMGQHDRGYVIGNFIAAQEANQSPKLRSAEYRQRQRELRRDGASAPVTNCDATATNRDDSPRDATRRHATSLLDDPRLDKKEEISAIEGVTNRDADRPEPGTNTVERPAKPDRVARIPDRCWKAADVLRDQVLAERPSADIGRQPWGSDVRNGARLKWADTLRLMVERDGRSFEELWEVMSWLFSAAGKASGFVVESPASLREKWDRIAANRHRADQRPANGRARSDEQPIRKIATFL